MSSKSSFYLEKPEPKRFGWSEYLEHFKVVENPPTVFPAVVSCETVIRGKILYLFGKKVLDRKMEVIAHNQDIAR